MMKKLLLTIIIYVTTLIGAVGIYAQDAAAPAADTSGQPAPNIFNLAYNNILLVLAVLVLIGVILAGLSLIWALIEVQKMKLLEKYGPEGLEKANLTSTGSLWSTISEKAWNLVPKDTHCPHGGYGYSMVLLFGQQYIYGTIMYLTKGQARSRNI